MTNYSELAVFITSCAGALAGLIYATQKSRCSTINCCCMECERPIPSTAECTDIESQLSTVEETASRVLSTNQRYAQTKKERTNFLYTNPRLA